ncbi:hypothetical protein C1I98_12345 [Spongiactinospora gelatinilytica]|uniref:N-acetyltransferase domain-containing protein n=1 Tax=Spongiactinospora gelatinilytica TaxID=2666298 RepID=A0A2W2GGV7_9ACTN|nr:XF1762 family protein [Spongiactinospora gelatinilytica]PZG48836.1 hypothetical protein C1I98_12345 [Spongiactinospora gelatinilytica]
MQIQTARAFAAWIQPSPAAPADAEIVLGVETGPGTLTGVVFAGSPISWRHDDGHTAEITCLATDGTPDADTALLNAVWQAARGRGYRRLIADTRLIRPGGAASALHAAGFRHLPGRPSRGAVWEIRTAGGGR